MPILGGSVPPSVQPLYFKSLLELDKWTPGQAGHRYDGVLKFKSRESNSISEKSTRGKLLVCHDYKGGYTESPFARSYTFNFWSSCDVFVYFSHYRITLPPPGWVTAAHRQGVKILGTLIFEPGAESDCLRLVVGKMPLSKTGQVNQSTSSLTLPLSPHYARVLAELARERGFDGYLLNFECPLAGSVEQTRAVAAWITLLQSEILARVGAHGETHWYDSVTIDGGLAWQNRLNCRNLPFFLSSTSLFSNYFWPPDYPALTAQYFLSLDVALTGNTPTTQTLITPKSMNDIYMGVDVWGRGSYGGGGFGCFKAITLISPETLGLSVALFGQAWTWESEQDNPGWTWERWWAYESKLWVGPISGTVEVSEAPQNEPKCPHEPFTPIASFFPRYPPPEPSQLSFHTTFCPGTGTAWFVEGVKVFQIQSGWTDVEKQTSVGDMIWPCPKLYWDDGREDEIPKALSCFYMDDAWNGGNSIRISISCPGSEEATAAYRALWLPIQSLHLIPQRSYEAHAIYKLEHNHSQDLETEFALSFKSLPGSQEDDLVLNVVSTSSVELTGGWTKLTIQFNLSGNELELTTAIGLVIAIVSENPTEPLQLPFLLGQLNVSPHVPFTFKEEDPLVLWADFTPTLASSNGPTTPPFSGTLSWDVATCFPIVTQTINKSPEDPLPAWNLQPTIDWFPSFLYFNIYAQPFADKWNVGTVDKAVWIGTSGLDGQRYGFDILPENSPFSVNSPAATKIRFYIQGVKDCGEVLEWQKCAYVDVSS